MANWIQLQNGWFIANINKNASTSIKLWRKDHKRRKPDGHKVAVIRHPCDRLVSCFENRPDYDGWSFEKFISFVCSTLDEEIDSHCRSQYLELDPWPDELIPFENINERFEQAGMPLRHVNKSERKNWKGYFTDDQLTRVKERYRRDFEICQQLGMTSPET